MKNNRLEIYAWIGEAVDTGDTGIMTVLFDFKTPVPLFAMNRDIAKRMGDVARQSSGHRNPRLVRFEEAEILVMV